MPRGMNVKNLKQRNKSLILYLLNDLGDMSRKELAKRTGLTPAAVTKLTAELIDGGFVREIGKVDSDKIGRREVLLTLRLEDKNILGINAEKDGITFCVCDLAGRVTDKMKTPLFATVEDVIREGKAFIERTKKKIVAVGVCEIGAPQGDFEVWKSADLKERFEKEFGAETVVENNVRAFAEAEVLFGDVDATSSALIFKWGPGVGSAILADGRLFESDESGVAEIGHYIVKEGGRACRCGRRGCLEAEAASDAIKEDIAACKDEQERERVVSEKVKLVATALLNTATIVSAKEVVLFGSIFEKAEVVDMLNGEMKKLFGGMKEARTSALNDKRDYIGAVAICAERMFFSAK